jgi:predicted transcriptional regulator
VLNEQNTKKARTRARDAEDRFIEQMGLIMAADGLPRIGGRLLALLLITEGDASLDDLARRLRVSKPSVSTNARLLEQRGVIEKVGRSADRRDYYRVADDVIGNTMQQRLSKLQRLQSCVAGARTSFTSSPTINKRLSTFAAACEHLSTLTASALAKWKSVSKGVD